MESFVMDDLVSLADAQRGTETAKTPLAPYHSFHLYSHTFLSSPLFCSGATIVSTRTGGDAT